VQRPLDGIRIVEVASWVFVPSAAAILSDWGADVIKVEPPDTGDPIRGLIGRTNHPHALVNRGKRSVAIDLTNPQGREVLYELVDRANVFMTSVLPEIRQKLAIDIDQIRGRNSNIVYAKGTAVGSRGKESSRKGYDFSTFWGRGALAESHRVPGADPPREAGGVGDLMSGLALAGGVAAALSQQSSTGQGSVVDASLLATAVWMLAMDVTAVAAGDSPPTAALSPPDRRRTANPLVNIYKTQDGRFLAFSGQQADRHWPELCQRIDRSDLVSDPRFIDMTSRAENREVCVDELDRVFAQRTLADWKLAFAGAGFVWEPLATVGELTRDPQVVDNEYIVSANGGDSDKSKVVANPVQFDEAAPGLRRAPEHGEHTEAVLLELGRDWADIAALKESGAII
jgi:crotonobetainyl-CoA:carnitine CoA-transferase CaiB-like acyl-CoA transferase